AAQLGARSHGPGALRAPGSGRILAPAARRLAPRRRPRRLSPRSGRRSGRGRRGGRPGDRVAAGSLIPSIVQGEGRETHPLRLSVRTPPCHAAPPPDRPPVDHRPTVPLHLAPARLPGITAVG